MQRERLRIFSVALFLLILTAAAEDPGKGNGMDVIAIGDSWMSYDGNTGIEYSLRKISGQPYRGYGVGGTQLLNGQIPSQYAQAKHDNSNIRTVIMTGGGNDLLRSNARVDLSSAGPYARERIDMLADRLVAFWSEMGRDGVHDVIYVFYSRGGGIAASVDYATKKIQPLCQSMKPIRCHWIDSDGTHPTDDGFNALARTIFLMMEKEGIRR